MSGGPCAGCGAEIRRHRSVPRLQRHASLREMDNFDQQTAFVPECSAAVSAQVAGRRPLLSARSRPTAASRSRSDVLVCRVQDRQPQEHSTRRQALRLGFLASAAVVLNSAGVPPASSEETAPKSLARGLIRGRLASCPSDAKCVSSAATGSPDKFTSPWTYEEEGSAREAADKLLALVSKKNSLRLIEEDSKFPYFHVEYDGGSLSGVCDLEFLFREKEKVVSVRGISRRNLQVYAFSAPQTSVAGVLLDIRLALSWKQMTDTDLFSM
ncbi:Thylakoid lumenal 17.9 kDa protein, chloroplastic [Porphyridium purpureum]|uniref:Thylakoid lumenal 17.9 kDa protein, chloroplastic n=1 Tax=Porphyridium purpureum TaxID=35688 RepID=A0A5J4YNI2_PORPP|nr:Thylakoid lumenal 17.9 kDa protein, chloroplastic [Porphyridium purpureum]|eukprot:POR9460..scf295_9